MSGVKVRPERAALVVVVVVLVVVYVVVELVLLRIGVLGECGGNRAIKN